MTEATYMAGVISMLYDEDEQTVSLFEALVELDGYRGTLHVDTEGRLFGIPVTPTAEEI